MLKKIVKFKYFIYLLVSVMLIILLNIGLLFPGKSKKQTITYDKNVIQIGISGNNNAEFLPCQCKYNPYGGLARLATFISDSRLNNPDIIWVNLGDFFSVEDNKEKHGLVMHVLGKMNMNLIVPENKISFKELIF